jgi:hypothetical protein
VSIRPRLPARSRSTRRAGSRRPRTTLFAALDILHRKVTGHGVPRHRHQEFIRFPDAIEVKVPKRKAIHVVVDDAPTQKHLAVRERLPPHPGRTFRFTPTSASRLDPAMTSSSRSPADVSRLRPEFSLATTPETNAR